MEGETNAAQAFVSVNVLHLYMHFYLTLFLSPSVWHFALDADDYGSYGGGQGWCCLFIVSAMC
jgi:hypothetical protein